MRSSLLLPALALLAAARADRYHPARAARPAGAGAAHSRAEPDAAERDAPYWYDEAFAAIDERLEQPAYDEVARNVVMFLGDGLSVPTLAPARALRGQRAGRPGEEERLAYERFPVTGLAKTYCVDKQIPDSACTATAYLCGVKNNYGTLGVTAQVPRYGCAASADPTTHLQSIAAWALADGRSAGIVTTTRVTHASPAGAYANIAERGWENDGQVHLAGEDPAICPDIADQLINSEPGNQFQVILGGGRREFRPNTSTDEENQPGLRWDGRDLVEEWRAQRVAAGHSHAYTWNRSGLLDAIANPPDYLLGFFEDGHMQYAAEAREAGNDEPTLAEMTEAAIRILSKNPKGFFLFVEGGRIDHAHHDNYPHLALDETLALADAVERADALLPAASSLLVLTADHSHVMAYNGYSRRGNDILGASDDLGDDGVPYMTLSYTNGPGYRDHVDGRRVDVTRDSNFRIVTTTRVTHASPAGAYANIAERGWENDGQVHLAGEDPAICPDIADQLINSEPGNQFQVILGGGRREFRPNTSTDEENQPGLRWDGRDLVEEWRAQRVAAGHSHAYTWNRSGLLDAIANPPDYLLGFFEDGHMQYAAEAREAGNDEPTLAEMTEAAIRILSKNPKGFFLFVEGGRIDHAHHDNYPHLALDETLALADAVERADALLPAASSLLVLTADHSHVMAYNGYSRRGNDILGASDDLGDDGVPYMTLSYTNGPGYRDHVDGRRVDVTRDSNFQTLWWRTHVDVPLGSETHGGDDVAVFARGPAQALFTGLYEQSQLPHLMAHAACLGPAARRRALCSGSFLTLANPVVLLVLSLVTLLFRRQ